MKFSRKKKAGGGARDFRGGDGNGKPRRFDHLSKLRGLECAFNFTASLLHCIPGALLPENG